MGDFAHMRPRQRLGWLVRQAYPGTGGVKRAATDLKLSEKTVRNLFADHWPGDETFGAIMRRFGNEAWRVVCAPEIDPIMAEIAKEEARLAREREQLETRRREVLGLAEARTYRVAPVEEQPPGPLNLDLFEEAAL